MRRGIQWIALALAAGCHTTSTGGGVRSRPEFASRLPSIRSAALISIDVKEYEVSAGGVVEFKEDWSSVAQQALQDTLIEQLRARQIALRRVDPAPETKEEIQDLRALSEAINASLRDFPRKTFDYSLGPVGTLLDQYQVDALVLVWARARLNTGGRKTLAFFAGGNATDSTGLAIILVDRSGDILWYGRSGRLGDDADLRSKTGAAELVQAVVGKLPPAKP